MFFLLRRNKREEEIWCVKHTLSKDIKAFQDYMKVVIALSHSQDGYFNQFTFVAVPNSCVRRVLPDIEWKRFAMAKWPITMIK